MFQEMYHRGLWCGVNDSGVMSIVRSVGNQLTFVQSIFCGGHLPGGSCRDTFPRSRCRTYVDIVSIPSNLTRSSRGRGGCGHSF